MAREMSVYQVFISTCAEVLTVIYFLEGRVNWWERPYSHSVSDNKAFGLRPVDNPLILCLTENGLESYTYVLASGHFGGIWLNGPVAYTGLLYLLYIQCFSIFIHQKRLFAVKLVHFYTKFFLVFYLNSIWMIPFFPLATQMRERKAEGHGCFCPCSDMLPVNRGVCGNAREPSEALTAGRK